MQSKNYVMKKKTLIFLGTLLCLLAGFVAGGLIDPVPASQAQTSQVLPAAPGSFSQLAKQASPAVVFISTVKTVKGGGIPMPFGQDDPFKDFFERFFGNQAPRDFKQQALGTGFIIDKSGFILTNNHVVEQTDEIKVKLSDGKEYNARIVGRDSKTDLALIKIEPEESLIPLPLGDSDRLEVGDWVVAIGNPFGLGHTVTAGIVSAKYRHIGTGAYDNFIQTDASINPGNSGGPLLNTAGEVVGINTAIYSQSGGSIGIGFAVPVNMAKDLLPQLKEGRVIRGWLGVMIQGVTPELKEKLKLEGTKGALVADVTKDGPADRAGIRRGDVILSFNGKQVGESNDLPYLVASTPVNRTVSVQVFRQGELKTLEVRIGEMPEEEREAGRPTGGAIPDLGMTLQEITPDLSRQLRLSETSGLVVASVGNGTPAADAGLRPGDVLLEVDQSPVKSLDAFNRKVESCQKGGTLLLLIKRQGMTLFVTLKIPN